MPHFSDLTLTFIDIYNMVSVVNPEDGVGGVPMKVVDGGLGPRVAQETRQHQHCY